MRQSCLPRIVTGCALIGLLLSSLAPRPGFAQSTNLSFSLTMVQPTNGSVFQAPVDLQLLAKTVGSNGFLTNVAFFAGTNKLAGEVFVLVLDPPGVNGVTGPVNFLSWTNVPPGRYALTAVATDNQGSTATSGVVNITVDATPPPEVIITSPANRATFYAPVDIPIFVYARATYPGASSNLYASLTNVEFFAGTNDLGAGERVMQEDPDPAIPLILLLNDRFVLRWTNPPPGAYALTVVATDDLGVAATSAPVNVTVASSSIISTGQDIVSIIAADPVSIEGTDCWTWLGETNQTPTWQNWPPAGLSSFTTCGPKDATFTVRRMGNAGNDLVIAYQIGGTATNGIDYVTLPNFVAIPAGENYGLITIAPLDGSPPATNKTVIITLTPSAGGGTDYVLGSPQQAAAIIFDGSEPHPDTGLLPGGYFHLRALGPDGGWFNIQTSSNLTDWLTVSTNQVVNGSIDFTDPDLVTNAARFYRVLPQTNGPGN